MKRSQLEITFGRKITLDEFDKIMKFLDEEITDDYISCSKVIEDEYPE